MNIMVSKCRFLSAGRLALLSLFGWFFAVSTATANSPPNIVLILADDLGYGDLGCYGNGTNRTPHLDRLAREGVRFLDFHSNAANCSPTRAALLTGRYQQRSGIEGALGENARGMQLSEVTLAERLREAGYATALIGKWHLGYFPKNGPTAQGFDRFVGHLHGATDYISHVDKYGRRDWWHNNQPTKEAGYNTKLITEHSIRFIEANRHRPFFLMVSHSAIHFPWMLPDDGPQRQLGKKYSGPQDKIGPHAGKALQPVVQAMIEDLDASVGQIVEAIQNAKLSRRTLVFFTSDNGGIVKMAGVPIRPENRISSNGPLRGQKHGLYEGGHRVPAIAWWPDTIPANRQSKATAMTMDLSPTFLDLAGMSLKDTQPQLDGVTLRGELLGKRNTVPARTLFWRQGNSAAVRQGDWKLVRIHNGPWQLFDLGQDLAEKQDLAADRPQMVEQLQAAWKQWERCVTNARPNAKSNQSAN